MNYMKLLYQITIFFCLAVFFVAEAQSDLVNEEPIHIEADKFEYFGDDKEGKIIAKGNVEAIQGDQKVQANLIEYDSKADTLIAEDKVKILEKTGYIIEADKVILSDKLRFGSMENFTVILPNKSTLKGKLGKKETEEITQIKKAYFTSCKICPGKSPIWEVTAGSTKLNEKENSLEYRNAVVKYYGVPVLYTPYFFHYTSKAKRKTGFLTPSYGGSSYLGTAVKIPYYFNISPNQDATATVLLSKKQKKSALEGEHRYLLSKGLITSSGSIASASEYTPPSDEAKPKHNLRYRFHSDSNLQLSNHEYFGWDINTTSDKSYMNDYGDERKNYLTSKIYNSVKQDKGYYEIQALSFQNLSPNDNTINNTPTALPFFESKHRLFDFSDGSRMGLEANLLNIQRYNGAETKRLSLKNRWEKDYLSSRGHVFNFFGSLRQDFYKYDNAMINNNLYTGNTHRTIPEAGVKWSYPLIKFFSQSKMIVTPMVSAIATPYTKYNANIYSEDSIDMAELNDGNLFSDSQYNGIDLVENTPRISYGLKGNLYYRDHINANALFGQMYRQKPQEDIIGGQKQHFSDYVGRLAFDYNKQLFFSYRYTLDEDTFDNKRNELESTVIYKKVFLTTSLLYYKDDVEVGGVKNRKEIYVETGANNVKGVTLSVNARKNLNNQKNNSYGNSGGFISFGSRVKYLNDCILYKFEVNRNYTRNINTKPSTTYWFAVELKNIS